MSIKPCSCLSNVDQAKTLIFHSYKNLKQLVRVDDNWGELMRILHRVQLVRIDVIWWFVKNARKLMSLIDENMRVTLSYILRNIYVQ